ncbi:MAG: ABC transporter ATP-binding protein [Fastidiosipilaceae bacterium]|jgi:iron complex transport system ATP-binding protein
MDTVKQKVEKDTLKSLKVSNLTFAYDQEIILNDLSFSAEGGELISILGPNGVGKSTLFRCILGLLNRYDGNILIANKNAKKIKAREIAKLVAYIPQSHVLTFNYSVLDMVLMGSANRICSIGSPKKQEKAEAQAALEKIGILDLEARGFNHLSGGEQQLVLLARAVMQNAPIWILDEPLANLDYGNQISMLQQLKRLAADGYLILQSIHNPNQAYQFSDRVIGLSEGRIIADGNPKQIMDNALIKALYGNQVEWRINTQ